VCALALEAATERLSIAACRGDAVRSFDVTPAREETTRIFEHAARLLAEIGAAFGDLDFVAFGCGPGSFTGVRVAAAAAQALGFARAIPVCRISSLAVLAAGAGAGAGQLVVACLDARMQRAYVGACRVDSGGVVRAAMPDAWIDPRAFTVPGTEPFHAVGSGWREYPDLAERHRTRMIGLDTSLLPSARDLLNMALGEFRAGRTVRPEEAVPEYLGQAPVVPGPQRS
jgi:tRNA threonylcarbamoyladenosine biosynthesis protein TsaB